MYNELFYFCCPASGSLKGEEEIGPCLTSKPTAVPPRPGGRLHGFLLRGQPKNTLYHLSLCTL